MDSFLWKHIAISRKVVEKAVNATIPKGSMRYAQYTVPDTVAVEPSLLVSFSTRQHTCMVSRAILSNVFEEQKTPNHNTFISGLLRTLFRTTFFEIAV